MYTPVYPVNYIKVGFKGSKLYRCVFVMVRRSRLFMDIYDMIRFRPFVDVVIMKRTSNQDQCNGEKGASIENIWLKNKNESTP